MATTYCDYYGSVGATGYQTYHGCVTAPPIDPADISGTCSILPEQCGEIRFDQGATWWCDYRWCVGDQTIPLNDYQITAVIFNPDGSRFATLTEGNGLAKNSETFRVKLTAQQTDSIKFSGRSLSLTIDLDLERINKNDPTTGYVVGDVVRVSAGEIKAYRRGAGFFNDLKAAEPTTDYFDCVTPLGYTTLKAVEDLYGKKGVDNILDDEDQTVEGNGLTRYQNTFNSILVDAEQTVALRMSKHFCPEDLIGSQFIWSRTRNIAAYYLSRRRGNEHYFESAYEEALRELDAIATGEIPPPKDITLSYNSMPSMSNMTVDDKFHLHKLRVQTSVSVGESYPGQDTNYHYGFFYGSI